MDKLVSIIIPVYNNEKKVAETLETIINQSYKNLEILIINDGSTDNSLEILKRYKNMDSRIKIFSQSNSGPGAARNCGLEISSGDYVTFVDADDLISNEIIRKLVETIERESVDVVRYNFYYSTKTELKEKRGELLNLCNRKFVQNEIQEEIIPIFIKNELCSYSPLLFMKKEIANKMTFDINTKYMEDTIFYIDLLYKIQSIYFLDEADYYYFYTPQSKQENIEFIYKYLTSLNYVYNKIEKILEENDKDFFEKKTCLNVKWLNTIIDYITIMLRINKKMTFLEWKAIIKQLNFRTNYKFNLLKISFYNRIAIKLLVQNNLKMLFVFTKFRNLIKKITK